MKCCRASITGLGVGMLTCLLTAGQVNAATIGLNMSSDKNTSTLVSGDTVTFTVGMTPAQPITGYTLDIQYDQSELSFVSSSQLVPFFNGAFVPSYFLDPATTGVDPSTNGLATSSSGRASVLQSSNSSNVGNLFSLTFKVLNPVADAGSDLLVGILNTAADDINPAVGDSAFTITPNSVSASIGAVPVPAAVWLLGSSVFALLGLGNRKSA